MKLRGIKKKEKPFDHVTARITIKLNFIRGWQVFKFIYVIQTPIFKILFIKYKLFARS